MKTLRHKSILILIALILATSSWFTPLVQAAETGDGASQFSTVGGLVYDGLTSIGGTVASLGGTLFDMSLSLFVLDMAGTVEDLELNVMIENTWELIRDIFNLLFIFSLIFIGFQILLEIQDSQAKRQLGMIVITALLINFSLYITRVVIDFGNIAAAELKESIVVETDPYQATVFGFEISNISSGFIAATDLPKLKDTTLELAGEKATGVVVLPKTELGLAHALALGLTVALMLMLVGFVLAAGALMMLGRFFYLTYMMMLSPLMFLGWVLPKFKSYSKGWWGKLVGQTLIGPIFILMLIIALRALQTIQKSQVNHELNTVTFLLSAIMVAGFTWAALVAAQKAAAYGADQTMGFSTMVNSYTRGFVGRNTLGRVGDNWDRALEKRGFSNKGVLRSVTGRLAKSKFGGSMSRSEARSASEAASQKRARYEAVHGKPNRRIGPLAIGGRSGGLAGAISNGVTATDKSEVERIVAKSSNEQVLELLGEYKTGSDEYKTLVASMTQAQYDAAMKAKPEELDDTAKATLTDTRQKETVSRVGGVKIGTATEAHLKIMGAKEIADNAADLKQSQFDKIIDDKEYSKTEKDMIKNARKDQMWSRFENPSTRAKVFEGKKGKEIAKLDEKILLDSRAIPWLTNDALSSILDEQAIAPADRTILSEKIILYKDGGSTGTTSVKSDPTAVDFLQNTPRGRQFSGQKL